LSWRDADEALEVLGELALIREADLRRDLGQGEVMVGVQELLRPRDAAREDVPGAAAPRWPREKLRAVVEYIAYK
jgi:hypothetical protein